MGNVDEISSAAALARPAFAEEDLTNNEYLSATTTTTFDVEKQPNSEVDKITNAEITAVSEDDSVNSSNNIIDFDGPNDPENPINWSPAYKWSLVVLISFMSCVVNLAILMCAPATPSILLEFHSPNHLSSTILLSIWEAGETIGPLLVGPLSEICGRLPIYNAANIAFILFSAIAAKSTNMPMLIAMRFFLGASVASTTLNPCIVGDMFRQGERGGALAVMGMTPFIAPILGPVVGGVVSQVRGWRWTFWLVTVICGAFEVGFLLLYRESYKITILERKAKRLRKETGNEMLRSRYHRDVSAKRLLGEAMLRPAKLLFVSPVIGLCVLVGAFQLGYTYVIITTLPSVFQDGYHFSEEGVGLSYLGLGIGMILSVVACGAFLDWYLKLKSRGTSSPKPELRLPPMLLGTLLIPLGIITFGWTSTLHLPPLLPILCTSLIGFAYVAVELSTNSYLVDAYGVYSASAMGALTVCRNLLACVMPLIGPPLFGRVGLGWGGCVLGGFGGVRGAGADFVDGVG